MLPRDCLAAAGACLVIQGMMFCLCAAACLPSISVTCTHSGCLAMDTNVGQPRKVIVTATVDRPQDLWFRKASMQLWIAPGTAALAWRPRCLPPAQGSCASHQLPSHAQRPLNSSGSCLTAPPAQQHHNNTATRANCKARLFGHSFNSHNQSHLRLLHGWTQTVHA